MSSEAVISSADRIDHRDLMRRLAARLPDKVASTRSEFERFLFTFEQMNGRTATSADLALVRNDWIIFCGEEKDSVPDYFTAYLNS